LAIVAPTLLSCSDEPSAPTQPAASTLSVPDRTISPLEALLSQQRHARSARAVAATPLASSEPPATQPPVRIDPTSTRLDGIARSSGPGDGPPGRPLTPADSAREAKAEALPPQ
jgi:hypothetical protein